ncbi:hypothetical protein ABR737_01060 [Streptomyces sp. Edi2]|uniref:hypothetical protein n=1 Tax=Streptomyces sp. Edi2 TaxID=3162528 RepID=UPI00330623EE
MTDTTPEPSYAQEALRAGTLVSGLQLLLERIQREPAVGRALALIETTDLRGPLDQAGLHALLAEAKAERDRCLALAERDVRRGEAGRGHGATCTCGDSDSAHARKLTDDGRLPCTRNNCNCHDLTFV